MKIVYVFVLIYTCLHYPLYCKTQSVRPNCDNLNNCNGTNIEICATNGRRCKRFSSECALQRDNCNATLSTAWNRTDTIECLNLHSNASGLCACPALRTCSNRPTTATSGICVHRDGHGCRLFRTECELARARCNGEVWHSIDDMQCRGFTFGQTRTCTCPKSLQCSRNQTQLCVQVGANNCSLYGNECDLEADRCRGEGWQDVSTVQCRGFRLGASGTCQCPRLLNCQRNVTNICVRNEQRRCQLVENEWELEQKRCEGTDFTIVDNIQCHNFTVNQLRNCSCPNMSSCANNSSNICTTTPSFQCKLFPNQCELEKAKCQGEALSITNSIQCRGLTLNTTRNCFCPRLRNCSRNSSRICVRDNSNRNNTCLLMRNECELEQAICEGKDFKRVDPIYCRNFAFNSTSTCFCPKLNTCNRNSSNICVMSASQCRLMRNECELEQANCEGKNLVKTHATQCLNFEINSQNSCSCPNLLTCSQNSTKICARTRRGCKLLTTHCEFEEAKCRGEVLRTVDIIHCRNFRNQQESLCFCPNLKTCSRNDTTICVKSPRNNCTLLRNECELERAKCQGQDLTVLPNFHCKNFNLGVTKTCLCPNLFNCSTNTSSLCAKTAAGCKLLRNQCELEHGKCRGTVLRTTSLQHCRGFEFGQMRNCSCPKLKTCSRNNTNICVRTGTGCKLIRNECELEDLRCKGGNIKVLPAIQCKSLRPGNEGSCACPNWLSCQQNSSNVCIETLRGCRLLKNQCELEQLKCQGEAFNVTSNLQCQGFAIGQSRPCACPELKTCLKQNSTNICVQNSKGCKVMRNSCDLELAKCKGEKWCSVDSVQCQNIPVGHLQNCTCPKMDKCAQNNSTNICVHLKGACKLMKNHCELEKAKCKGQAWSPTSSIQCQDYKPNEWRWCACPRLLNCCSKATKLCVKGPQGCKLLKSDCELQMARCKGEVWSRADDLECKGYKIGQAVQRCTCPKLTTCLQQSSSTTVSKLCVRNRQGCKLLRNDCELERLLCNGEAWQPVESLQCRNFSLHETRSCHCPNLGTCSNTTRVCGKLPGNQCSLFRSECDMRWSQCEGQKLSLTLPQRCQNLRFDTPGVCRCPELRGCNRRLKICGRKGRQCKLFRNECDYRNSTCLEENWQRSSLGNCCQFGDEETKSCTLNMATAACGMLGNQCRLFSSRCALDAFNLSTPRKWRLVNRSNCQCIRTGRAARCAHRPTCRPTNTAKVCARHGRNVMLFNSRCHLIQHNFRRCTNFRAVRASECRNIPE